MADQDRKRKFSGRPDSRMSEELDALILKTATRLFGEQGYAATSVEQIAACLLYTSPSPRDCS